MPDATPSTPSAAILHLLRAQGGVATGDDLHQRLGASALSSALPALLQTGTVRCVGAALHYLLPRSIPGVGAEVPVFRVDAQGVATPFGRIIPLQGGRIWVDEADGLSQLHDGLPWFLNDMRPQGFMGRTFAHAHPALQLGTDPRHWSDDDVLKAMALYGDDLPGNLIVGNAALARFGTHASPASPSSRVASQQDYPALAELAMLGTLPGSSAGGEQPKFCTRVGERHVIVKFSPAGRSDVNQRTRDLLVCEHLALQTLASAGLPAARTRIFTGAERTFLEAERFDRTAHGRIGMVSLLVYDAQYIGAMDNWAATAQRMQAGQLLTPQDAADLCLLEAFGILIGNTDRHYGNISLLLEGDDWRLSPTYDMLPMLYAPVGGELVARDFGVRPPSAATQTAWPAAQQLAQQFWQTAAADDRISADFRAIAQRNAQVVQAGF